MQSTAIIKPVGNGASSPEISWQAIKAAISPELYHNPAWRGLNYLLRDLTMFAACFTLLYFVESWYYLVPLWLVGGMIIAGLFVLGHDLVHGSLFESKRLTYRAGVICCLPSLVPFRQFAQGHNRHHGHTVQMGRDFVWHPLTPAEYRARSWFGRALHRLYWSAGGAGIYYLLEIWWRDLMVGELPHRGALIDRCAVILFAFASAGALFYAGGHAAGEAFDPVAGLWMWTKVWLVPFAVWNYLAGITLYLQHIHDRIPWKSEADWTAIHGQFFGTVNYHMPAVINFFIHNAYLHMPHHVQIRIPFYHLPGALADIRAVYGDLVQESYTPIRDYLRLTGRCKLFDPDSGRWYTYREAREISLQAGSQ